MTGPPSAPAPQSDPGGFQARAGGQQVEVRTYDGELARIVPVHAAKQLVDAGLADSLRHCVRLKNGIRWLPPRFDRPSGRPDLNQLERREPDRYAALWKGTVDAHVGKGALGRCLVDSRLRTGPAGRGV